MECMLTPTYGRNRAQCSPAFRAGVTITSFEGIVTALSPSDTAPCSVRMQSQALHFQRSPTAPRPSAQKHSRRGGFLRTGAEGRRRKRAKKDHIVRQIIKYLRNLQTSRKPSQRHPMTVQPLLPSRSQNTGEKEAGRGRGVDGDAVLATTYGQNGTQRP